MRTQPISMNCEKEEVSPEELRKAAKAVVDAAICCHQVKTDEFVSAETRSALIEAVYHKPDLTQRLFQLDEFPLH